MAKPRNSSLRAIPPGVPGAALRISVLTEAANVNIPVPRFDPVTPKPQSSGRPHTHVWWEEELPWCPGREELQMLQRNEAKRRPPAQHRCGPAAVSAGKLTGTLAGGFNPRETQTVVLFVCSVKSEDLIINLCGLKYVYAQSSCALFFSQQNHHVRLGRI